MLPYKKGSKSKRMRAILSFTDRKFVPIKSMTVISDLLPPSLGDEIMAKYRKQFPGNPRAGTAEYMFIRHEMNKAYHNAGLTAAKLRGFSGLDTGNLRILSNEPRLGQIKVRFEDDSGKPAKVKGENQLKEAVLRKCGLRTGDLYTTSACRQALSSAFSLGVRSAPPRRLHAWPPAECL